MPARPAQRRKPRTLRRGPTRRSPGPAPAPEVRGPLVVGIGASAGGLEAFTQLLRALPVDTGMAFVLVQHLSPARSSALAEILSRATTMPVREAVDRLELEPDRVYVAPPDANLALFRGRLRLIPREERGVQHPIDSFFRSLAADQRHRAIGVVLSGTANDGTTGMEEIKAEGGFTFAQDETAQQAGMPRSAVNSGCVDFVLPPFAIAAELARIARIPYVLARSAAPETGATGPEDAQARERLAPVLALMRAATGVDFSQYKARTLARRIGRRMAVQKQESVEDYAEFLRRNPAEIEALHRDVLISVTSFFRDREVFEELAKKWIPALLKKQPPQEPLRVWVAACSTGEEAYSLAMLFSEALESMDSKVAVQIFATDVSESSIAQARAGVYARERMHGVSAERTRRFFTEEAGRFRVAKELRAMCLFSRHDLTADPPFSRMDFFSCRNLLIYLEPAVQERILRLLHYALKEEGLLLLGSSETVGHLGGLFAAASGKRKIYRRNPGAGRIAPSTGARAPAPKPSKADARTARSDGTEADATRRIEASGKSVFDEADRLMASFAPPAVLVDASGEILQYHGNTEPFLAPAQGIASHALQRMARKGLTVPLQALLHRARHSAAPVSEVGLRFRSSAGWRTVDLNALRIQAGPGRSACFLVLFQDASGAPRRRADRLPSARGRKAGAGAKSRETQAAKVERLERELDDSRRYLQMLTEQFESANEELQATNEEAQSANEELQSVNEELETSKEEIQSSNEELTTINEELNNRNLELAHLSGDLKNLLDSARLAIVIVSSNLAIRRFSPLAERILGIRAADLGRPVTEVRLGLESPDLGRLLTESIATRSAREFEVRHPDGLTYSLRIHPYLTSEGKADGAVLAWIDVTALRRSLQYAESIVATVSEPLLVLDAECRVRNASRSYCEYFGVTRGETEGRLLWELGGGQWNNPELRKLMEEVVPRESSAVNFAIERVFGALGRRALLVSARPLQDPLEGQRSILFSVQDDTERQRQTLELANRNAELEASDTAKSHFLAVLSHELRSPLNVIRLWAQILLRPGRSEETLRRGLEIIDHSSSAQARLVEDLLDVHRIRSGRLRLELVEADLAEIVDAVLESMAPVATQKGVRLVKVLEPGAAWMEGDPTRLQQVFANVLGNAIKFTPPGGSIRVVLRRSGERADVEVSDTGAGMDAEELRRLFQTFRSADPLTRRSSGGLGLGLTIAKQLLALHGGTVAASSPGPGQGATFTMSLPLLAAPRMPARPPRTAVAVATEPRVPLGGIHVLVVDDERETREALRWVLQDAGARTTLAASVEEALAAIRSEPPDMLLSDIGMPDRNGYDLIRAVRTLSPAEGGRIAAVALTAYAAAEDREAALAAGFQAHLAKPLDPARLVATLAALRAQAESGPDGCG